MRTAVRKFAELREKGELQDILNLLRVFKRGVRKIMYEEEQSAFLQERAILWTDFVLRSTDELLSEPARYQPILTDLQRLRRELLSVVAARMYEGVDFLDLEEVDSSLRGIRWPLLSSDTQADKLSKAS